jgi:2-(1,2-epoxy-1,2-dihydrophenyl)acetyl-CoA isomerase
VAATVNFETVDYARDDAVAIVTLNRPTAMNGFDTQLRTELLAALTHASNDTDVRVVILTGAGRCFSAGADLKAGFPSGEEVQRQLNQEYGPCLTAIAAMPKPVISAVNGFAAGIGLSFALVADLVVMGESAFLLSPFSNIGLVPDGGATWLLPRLIGYQRAYQLCIENERIQAADCLQLGLANRVVPDDELLSATVTWAHALSRRAPLALARTKQAMRRASELTYLEALKLEAELQRASVESADCAEGVSAFLEKRKPHFTGN